MKAGEKVCVIASRGREADPGLTLRAELATFEVRATRKDASATFLLEVTAPGPIGGTLDYQWETGDPGARPRRTSTPSLEYTYRKPGEHAVRVTLLDRDAGGAPVGEATGRVTVPSALQLTILSDKTGRPVGGAQTAEHDMSQDLEVSRRVRLTPKPKIAPPSRPPAPPSEPTPRPESTPVPTATPKAAPETPTFDACMARHRPLLDEARAHNRAQNPASQGIATKVMGVDARCSATYNACLAAVKERGRTCPVGPDGTFSQCFAIENRGWLDCANEEVDCSERAIEAQCRMK